MKDLQEDNLFGPIRERLGRYEEAPSEELWEKIAKKKRDRVWPLFLEPMAVLLVGSLLFFSNDVTKDERTKEEMTRGRGEEMTKKEAPIQQPADQPKISYSKSQIQSPSDIVTQPETRNQQHAQNETRNQKQELRNLQPEIIPADSIEVISPILTKIDSSTSHEVIPPYKKPRSRVQFYLSVTPSLSFQKMIPTGNDEIIIQGFAPRSPMSMERFGFGIDAGFQKEINRFFEFYGGLSFYRQQQQLTYLYYDKEAEVTRIGDSWTFEIDRIQHTRTFDYTMANLGASAGLLLTIKGEKLKQKLGAGLMYSYNFKDASYIAYKLLYRSELKINDRLSWYIEPNFIYSFVSKEKLSEPFTLKPYRAGMSTGLLYKF